MYVFVLLVPLDTPHQVPRFSCRPRGRALICGNTRQDLLDDLVQRIKIVEGIWRILEDRQDDDADQRRRWCGRGQEGADDSSKDPMGLSKEDLLDDGPDTLGLMFSQTRHDLPDGGIIGL